MYLTAFEMELMSKKVRETAQVLDRWDMAKGWPPDRDRAWVVELPPAVRLVADAGAAPNNLCRMLRTLHDPAEDSPWCFVPGTEDKEIWLVCGAPWLQSTTRCDS